MTLNIFSKMIEQSKTGTSESSTDLTWNKLRAHWLDVCTGSVYGIPAGSKGFGFCSCVDLYNEDCPRDTDSGSVKRQYLLCCQTEIYLSAQLTVWTRSVLFVWSCPVHCRIFSHISDLYPVSASRLHPSRYNNQKCPGTLPNISGVGGQKSSPVWELLQ